MAFVLVYYSKDRVLHAQHVNKEIRHWSFSPQSRGVQHVRDNSSSAAADVVVSHHLQMQSYVKR